ncbi:hypothetical protein D3C78_1366100 [compost metagenome]
MLRTFSTQDLIGKTYKIVEIPWIQKQQLPNQISIWLAGLAKIYISHPSGNQIECKILFDAAITGTERTFFYEAKMYIFTALRFIRIRNHA